MPPLLEGAIPARPHAARPAKGFFVNPAIYERETGRDGKLIIGVKSTRPSEDVFQFARVRSTGQNRQGNVCSGEDSSGMDIGVLRGCVYFQLEERTDGRYTLTTAHGHIRGRASFHPRRITERGFDINIRATEVMRYRWYKSWHVFHLRLIIEYWFNYMNFYTIKPTHVTVPWNSNLKHFFYEDAN